MVMIAIDSGSPRPTGGLCAVWARASSPWSPHQIPCYFTAKIRAGSQAFQWWFLCAILGSPFWGVFSRGGSPKEQSVLSGRGAFFFHLRDVGLYRQMSFMALSLPFWWVKAFNFQPFVASPRIRARSPQPFPHREGATAVMKVVVRKSLLVRKEPPIGSNRRVLE